MTIAAQPTANLKVIDLKVISDTICPFCYLGYKKIDAAIKLAKDEGLNYDFKLKFEPFQLDPTLPLDEPLVKRDRYIARFGSAERIDQMQAAMKERGRPYGIEFSYGGMVRQTTASHRLLEHAYQLGGERAQRALAERFFEGYFEKEQDIGDHDYLARAVVEANIGMTKEDALAFLKSDEGMEDYEAGLKTARMIGVSGVPFTIINNKLAVSGAQEPEDFLAAFKQAAAKA